MAIVFVEPDYSIVLMNVCVVKDVCHFVKEFPGGLCRFPGNPLAVGYLGRISVCDVLDGSFLGVESSILGNTDCARCCGVIDLVSLVLP